MLKDTIDSHMVEQIEDRDIRQLLKNIEKNKGLIGLLIVSQGWWSLFLRQFWIGISRGLGMSVGCTIILTILYNILSYIITIDIPFLTTLLKEIVSIIKGVH